MKSSSKVVKIKMFKKLCFIKLNNLPLRFFLCRRQQHTITTITRITRIKANTTGNTGKDFFAWSAWKKKECYCTNSTEWIYITETHIPQSTLLEPTKKVCCSCH